MRLYLPALTILLAVCAGPIVYAQESQSQQSQTQQSQTQQSQPQETQPRGLQVSSVAVSEAFFVQSVPRGISTYGDVFLGSAATVSAAANVTWNRTTAKSYVNLWATPSYGARFGDTGSRFWNQSLIFTFTRRLGNKWTMGWDLSGQVMNFDESLFSISTLSRVASSGVKGEDLADAFFQGKSSNPFLGNAAYNSFHPDNSTQRFLFGRRTASASGQASLKYAPSSRFSLSFTGGNILVRHLADQSDPDGFQYPQVTSVSGGVSMNYSLSPRLQIGASANFMRSQSLLLKSNTKLVSVYVNRKVSRNLFLQGSVGIGSNANGNIGNYGATYSAGFGYSSFRHTAVFTYDRSMGDPYALALGALRYGSGYTATWHYGQPRSSWWLDSTYNQVLRYYTGIPETNTWSVTSGMGRRFGESYAVVFQYTMGRVGAKRYIQNGRQYQLEQTGMRVQFLWFPTDPYRTLFR